MGQSTTDAILFWGYVWEADVETSRPWNIGKDSDEDDETDENEDEDWETRYADTQGLHEPENNDYSSQEWRDYWDSKRKLITDSNCLIDTFCAGHCPMPLIAISKSFVRAHRGDAIKVSEFHLTINPLWRSYIDNFCRVMGIPIPQTKPQWYLVSDWN